MQVKQSISPMRHCVGTGKDETGHAKNKEEGIYFGPNVLVFQKMSTSYP